MEQLQRPRRRPARRHLALHRNRVVTFTLDGVRLVRGLPVSGTATWDRYAETMRVSLDVPGGHLTGGWDTRAVPARAVLTGRLEGRRVRAAFPAP